MPYCRPTEGSKKENSSMLRRFLEHYKIISPRQAITSTLVYDDFSIEVIRKPVKNLRIVVLPPHGHVRLSVPWALSDHALRRAIDSRLTWIRHQRAKFQAAAGFDASTGAGAGVATGADAHTGAYPARSASPDSQATMNDGTRILFLGQRYHLSIHSTTAAAHIVHGSDAQLELYIRGGSTSSQAQRQACLDSWYRQELKKLIPPLLSTWQERLGVQASAWGIKRMKTRWGSCNTREGRIWLNLHLAQKPLPLLEYVVVHELVHLLEPTHNARFKALMTQYLPQWRQLRHNLNS